MADALRIAVIGCGAVSRQWHLPALAKIPSCQVLLVDPDAERTVELCRSFGFADSAQDYTSILDRFDAALVAVPNHLHAPMCRDLLQRGKHVFVEKPMATTGAECDAILSAATAGRAVLGVGLMRRYMASLRWAKSALNAGLLGRVAGFDFREGFELTWPFSTDYFMRPDKSGGGVLMDTGAHALDLITWWFGDCAKVEYKDDSYGGVEADCELQMTMVSGAVGAVELSRTRKLRNTCIIRGERGELEVGAFGGRLMARPARLLRAEFQGVRGSALPPALPIEPYVQQLTEWISAIRSGGKPGVSGVEGARSVRLIERCYASRRIMEFPWIRPESFLQSPGVLSP